jgi:predicted RNA-binding Zn-ribbon protein involved in translation (DUF1610 family)
MSFEIPKEVQKLKEEFVKQFEDDVVKVNCNNCGNKTVMNRAYAKLVPHGIGDCNKCRKF